MPVTSAIDIAAVGNRLRRVREYHGMTQVAFAESVRIDPSSYSKIERGEKPLKAEMAYNVAERWGVSMDFLYRGRLTELPHKLANAFMQDRTSGDR